MLRFLLSLVLLAFAPGLAVALWHQGGALFSSPSLWVSFVGGTVAGWVLDQLVLRRLPRFEVFEHELTHAVAALLFLRDVRQFVVTRDRGGYVQHSGGFSGRLGDDFIGLAPYVLPTFTAVSVLARPWVPAAWFPWYDGWIGLTFGYHLWSTLRESALGWTRRPFVSASGEVTRTDLGQRGLIFSTLYVVVVGLAIHGVLLAILTGGYGAVRGWAGAVWSTTLATSSWLAGQAARWASSP